jgi:hypothetical protein
MFCEGKTRNLVTLGRRSHECMVSSSGEPGEWHADAAVRAGGSAPSESLVLLAFKGARELNNQTLIEGGGFEATLAEE